MKRGEKKIKVCPVCGSPHIHYVAGMITGEKYVCEDCGYVGSLIIEMDVEEYKRWIKEKKFKK